MTLITTAVQILAFTRERRDPPIDRSKFSLYHSKPDYISASNNSGMNPFMIAVEKGHLEVVNAMMEKDPGLVSLPMGSGSTMIHWALEKDHHRSAFFKV